MGFSFVNRNFTAMLDLSETNQLFAHSHLDNIHVDD